MISVRNITYLFVIISLPMFSYNYMVTCLFWAPQKRLNKVIITKLSRFFLFLRAYYVQKVCTQHPLPFNYTQLSHRSSLYINDAADFGCK